MKIAYLSSYRDDTELAMASLNHILACEAAGFDVVCRPVSMLPPSKKIPCLVEHLENKNLRHVDIMIQHIVPSLFEYQAGIKNIGCFGFDARSFERSSWAQCCNLMDAILVPSNMCREDTINSGVTKPVYVVPYSCPEHRFLSPPSPLDLPQLKDKCVFYVIGEFDRCNNFAALFRAYYAAFSSRDDVALVVKADIPGQSVLLTNNAIKNMVVDIKKSTHIYANDDAYPPIVTIADDLSQAQLDRLHVTCDVFVHPARGSAWGIAAYNAMGFGNPAILSICGAYADLIDHNVGWPIPGQLSPCFGMTDKEMDLYTGAELWFEPDLEVLIESMESAYQAWQEGVRLHDKGQAAMTKISKLTSINIGQLMMNILKGEDYGVDIRDDTARYQPSIG